jgi:hypothetical protein
MPIVAPVVGSLVGAGASALFGGKGGGSSGGYTQQVQPQYSFTEPRLQMASDYVTGNLSRMAEGKFPTYYQKLAPQIKQGMTDSLYQTFYGQPGNRTGSIQDAMSIGAMSGLKGKRAMSPAYKQLMDYNTKSSAIDQYMAQLGMNVMQQGEQTYLNASNQMPTGPGSQNIPYTRTEKENPWGGVGTAIGQGVSDWVGGWGQGNSSSPISTGQYGWGVGDYVNPAEYQSAFYTP